MPHSNQILTVAQMRAGEQALIDSGQSVESLMERAGIGVADLVWRVAAHRPVTVLCGPGNNGGDGYVIARELHRRGATVRVIAAADPATPAAQAARARCTAPLVQDAAGGVLVDCLFGSGLARPLSPEMLALLQCLAVQHPVRIAVDLPSGIESDSGAPLNESLPTFQLTVALGAWKLAHFLLPGAATMGTLRLVDVGVAPVAGAAQALPRPAFAMPGPLAHKYTRGLLAVIGGEMPGAALLAAQSAQLAGAGYVKLLSDHAGPVPSDLVQDSRPLEQAVSDERIGAVLIGPGLGRDATSLARLSTVLAAGHPAVLDADALMLLGPAACAAHAAPRIVTPHGGELTALERSFGLDGQGTKPQRALALARSGGMVVVAKGADTVIAAPDGRLVLAPPGSGWLSTAGTGDVLAGAIASRLATGADAFAAACEGVWLHARAARMAAGPFTASALAARLGDAYAAAL
ncbi:MAG: hypothetical protein RLZZ08_2085 [Pseudomonadota bacterium]|jgi:hydroxyethylthiazole kinase-like uncharacterized protein yjeF